VVSGEEIDHDTIPGVIVCPHCGYELKEEDAEGEFYTEDGVESWCHECGAEFTCYGSTTWLFTTTKGHVETAARKAQQEKTRQKWKDNPPVKHYEEDSDG
jgi:DNA-directed RNA polymerase subunit RPC12/RpoP